MRYRVEGVAMVAESFDRFVTLQLSLLVGDEVLGGARKDKIDAEERKATSFGFQIEMSEERAAAFGASQDPRLRIRMTVAKDGAGPYVAPDQTLHDQRPPN